MINRQELLERLPIMLSELSDAALKDLEKWVKMNSSKSSLPKPISSKNGRRMDIGPAG